MQGTHAKTKKLLLIVCTIYSCVSFSQNETNNWYFGANAGLSFATNPPTVLTNGALNTWEGCASISNSTGSLLFYTDGINVYDQTHSVMANGTGLLGNGSTTQAAIIVRKPSSSSIYYIFTLDDIAGPNGLKYSEVDMNLAAGMGSVTLKNYTLHSPSCEKMTAIRHCNGYDVWVVTHDWGSNNFRTYLITAAGVSLTPVMSSAGTSMNSYTTRSIGQMKVSPNGKKLGLTVYDDIGTGPIEIYDFNNATGSVSNVILLGNYLKAYSCEFSPDGTKFYAGLRADTLMQWDICAGTNTAIVASLVTFTTNPSEINGQLQLANNGKIYFSKAFVNYLGLINSPNLSGTACSYIDNGISTGTAVATFGLPNFITSFFKPALPPFTYTSTCSNYTFSNPPTPTVNAGCGASANPVTNVLWNFGDPTSGAANTSTLSNPSHNYSTPGTYMAQLVLYYACSSDTIRATINTGSVNPNISISGTDTICNGGISIFTASGASTYTWSTGVNTTTVLLSPSVTTVYSVTGTGTNNCLDAKLFTIAVNTLPNMSISGSSTICNGDKKKYTASGAVSYTWSTGAYTNTISLSPSVTSVYSVMGTGINGCKGSKQFTITVNKCTGINGVSEEEYSFNIYPNPSSGDFFLDTESDLQVKLMNQLCEIVFEGDFQKGKHLLTNDHLSCGVYFLKATGTDFTKTIRLIKTE